MNFLISKPGPLGPGCQRTRGERARPMSPGAEVPEDSVVPSLGAVAPLDGFCSVPADGIVVTGIVVSCVVGMVVACVEGMVEGMVEGAMFPLGFRQPARRKAVNTRTAPITLYFFMFFLLFF